MIKNKTRLLAFNILQQVFLHQKFSNKLINKTIQKNNLSNKDKNLLVQLTYGTIKNKLFLETMVNSTFVQQKIKLRWKILLWMSLYQYLFLSSIPTYAIVNESVEIAKIHDQQIANFINFAFKKLLSDSWKEKKIDFLTRYSFPYNIYSFLKKQYDIKIINEIVKDNILEPKISVRINYLKTTKEKIKSQYSEYTSYPSNISSRGLIFQQAVINSPMFEQGEIFLQDEMSMKIVETLDPHPQEKVLDMCSAPGGETTYIAELTFPSIVDAFDISIPKIELIEQNATRLGLSNIVCHVLDSRKINNKDFYDRILLDAPCSGFGVWKRKPELKYKLWTKNMWTELLDLQKELINKAYELLKPGGILLYSTCTFNLNENNYQINKFLVSHPTMEKLEEKQVFGYEANTDGFYWCKMKKNV